MPSDDISRLYDFVAGTTIVADQVDAEFNQIITTINNKVGRATTETISGAKTFTAAITSSNDNGWSGINTFSHASTPIKTDIIAERTSANGVAIDSVVCKDGFIRVPAGAGYTPATNGDIGYDSTSHTYDVYVNGAARYLIHDGNVPTAAAQSDQETATSTTLFVTPGRQQYHPSAPKAWVRFNGTGTVAIAGSYNVTSITDNGVGDYTINFTTAFSGAGTYAGIVSAGMGVAGSAVRLATGPTTAASTTSAWRLETTNISGTLTDTESINAIFCGDQ